MNELAPTVENIEENNPTFEEDLMLFVDQNSDYYKKKWDNTDPKKKGFSFNAGGFFFTFFWLGYRKMYKLVFFISLRSEEHTSELQSRGHLVCRLLLEKKKYHRITEPI